MKLKPISEKEATPEVKQIYGLLKTNLELSSVPLFFQFLGAFPQYLSFINKAIIDNLKSPEFQKIIEKNADFVENIFQDSFTKGLLTKDFIKQNQNKPEFYNLKKELHHIFLTNAKLLFVFLSLREAVKGWAVAAKKLESHFQEQAQTENKNDFFDPETKSELIYNTDIISANSNLPVIKETSLSTRPRSGLEIALLPKYLKLCEAEFDQLIKTEAYLYFRVEVEKICLRSLDQMPYPIFSPVNLVFELAQKYPNFSDLLYLLSEHFPTYAVARYLFSGYMLY